MYGSLETLLAPANTRRAPLWAHVRQQLEAQGAVGPELEVGVGVGRSWWLWWWSVLGRWRHPGLAVHRKQGPGSRYYVYTYRLRTA